MRTIPVPFDVLRALVDLADVNPSAHESPELDVAVDLLSAPSSRFVAVANGGETLLVDTEAPGRSGGFAPAVVVSGYREKIERLAAALNGSPDALAAWAAVVDAGDLF